ncbi:Nuf2 family-domain-containing protein [Vararia minispora EC-137]|uniref:Nuf2 family-domain-containing protein n=1 Tax=Vararia minispora EC-137 TaxID=1314806 RepID=A0ACB8QSC1_9AGAM|nr:Nuf2 family-domain-containing protein [Vararia minispora EC-137]
MDTGKPFWYPNLSDAEIIDALSGWSITATPKLLTKPTEEFVTAVYLKCVEKVFGLTMEDLKDPIDAALEAIRPEHRELHTAGVTMNVLCYHFTRFADAAKIPDFSTKDVVLPESKRTRLIFSAFINFVNFSEQHADEISRIREEAEHAAKERERQVDDLGRIRGEIAGIQCQRARDEPRANVLRQENAAITAELIAMQELQTRVLAEIDALKSEKSSLLQRKESLSGDTALAADTVARTRSRVVKSPERLRRNIDTMGASQAEDKRTLTSQEVKVRDLQAKANALLAIEKGVRDCIEHVQIVDKEMRMLENAARERADTRGALEERRIERTELELKLERAQNQLSKAQEKLERAQRDLDERRRAGQETIERLQHEYEVMASERKDNEMQVEELRQQANEIERKIADHLKAGSSELDELLSEYYAVQRENEIYMETLAYKLGLSRK